ncbi:MAG: YiaA/YiaB family inner membrane protein [Pseudanabaenaceae cyanobacterium SKYGB_i_bin29]|nr:YiaA/YiaB family inner membrane protein [Pseudanabaenaceae cyanobacterium SKYG29]MDW8421630.1 YiaA/YiaB family inner membrane protein [Pseudanabaenaceae cyanobacterium SKYGB_i_bin29]
MKPIVYQKDTNAWILQVWVAFFAATSATAIGMVHLPVEPWVKSYIGIGYLFSLSAAFNLSKTVRDNQEASRLTARVDEAMVEKILRENHMLR